jgi:hypothetical protein
MQARLRPGLPRPECPLTVWPRAASRQVTQQNGTSSPHHGTYRRAAVAGAVAPSEEARQGEDAERGGLER